MSAKSRLALFTALLALASTACPGSSEKCTQASGEICTIVGTGVSGLSPDGFSPVKTELYLPQDTTVAPDGRLFIIDWNNHRVRVLDFDGMIRTVVGTGELGDAPNGPALESSLNHPTHVSFDLQGNMFVSAWHNSKVLFYDPNTLEVTTICGTGARDFNGDGLNGTDTFLDLPVATVVAPDGSLLISDQANQRVRALGANDIVTTIVGTGEPGYSGDGGPAIDAQLNLPVSQSAPPAGRIALDDAGRLFIADTLNHVIRMVDLDGIITTVAGNGIPDNGTGTVATETSLQSPSDVAVDRDGNFYIADTDNSCVRRVDSAGAIETVAGICGQIGYSGDGGPATAAVLNRPYGVEVAEDGTLYIADTHNHVIRAVYP